MKEFTIEPKADQRPDHRITNALDDAAETIRGRIDHDKAHGVRPVKAPQKERV